MKLSNATLRDLPDPILLRACMWLGQHKLCGNPIDEPRFADAFEGCLQIICADGLSTSLNKYLYGYN